MNNNFEEEKIVDLNEAGEAERKEGQENIPQEEKNISKEEKTSPLREALSWVFTFAAAILVALVLKNFVIINATVPTGSMENTIMPGDDLFGFRLAYQFSETKRGDIIIFKYPDDEEEKYVKRIIGLPGETVRISNAKVYIDDSETPLQEEYLKDEWTVATGPFEFQVPEGCYFVMGDNCNNSEDSRVSNIGNIKRSQFVGKITGTIHKAKRQ